MSTDIFEIFNRVFGNMDAMFRDVEKEYSVSNLLPTVTLPSVKSYYSEQRTLTEDGVTTHYHNGKVSNLNGPAITYEDDREDEYWIDGKCITKEEHDKIKAEVEDNREHVIYIDGTPKKVTGKKLKALRHLMDSG